MNSSLQNPKTRREFEGACNICLQPCRFTEDHIPPKGYSLPVPVIQQTMLQDLARRNGGSNRYSVSQNGVKFRTLCPYCNNTRLGKWYDPSLIVFANRIKMFLETSLSLPGNTSIRAEPHKLIRAVLGHMLAAKGDLEHTKFDDHMRDFFLDQKLIVPRNLHLFYWLHRSDNFTILRDFVMPQHRNMRHGMGFFSILKFYPIAFLVSDQRAFCGLPDLVDIQNKWPDKEQSLPIVLKGRYHPNWPEMVDDNSFVSGGASVGSSVFGRPKNR